MVAQRGLAVVDVGQHTHIADPVLCGGSRTLGSWGEAAGCGAGRAAGCLNDSAQVWIDVCSLCPAGLQVNKGCL